jgi:hypothetical protein
MMIPCVFDPLISSSLEQRNFKNDVSGVAERCSLSSSLLFATVFGCVPRGLGVWSQAGNCREKRGFRKVLQCSGNFCGYATVFALLISTGGICCVLNHINAAQIGVEGRKIHLTDRAVPRLLPCPTAVVYVILNSLRAFLSLAFRESSSCKRVVHSSCRRHLDADSP